MSIIKRISTGDFNAVPIWQQVAGFIRRSIQTGELMPGDRIVELQISESLGISQAPVREALRQLQQQGILNYRRYAGTVVAQMSPRDAMLAVKARVFLETEAVRLILESGGQQDMQVMDDIVAEMSKFDDGEISAQSVSLDEQFHRQLVMLSGSEFLKSMWDMVDPYTRMAIAFRLSPADHPSAKGEYENHLKLLQAIKTGDKEVAGDAINRHMTDIATVRNGFKGLAQTAEGFPSQETDSGDVPHTNTG